MNITFSVVIPCYNEEKYLGLLLEDLKAQTMQPHQVIVADSRSTDNTVAVAKTHGAGLKLQIVSSKIRTPGAARNSGATQATGNYIVFLDADTRLYSRNFLKDLAAATENGTIDYITPLYTTDSKHPVDVTIIKMINLTIRKYKHKGEMLPGMGVVICVRRNLHEQVGGFDDHMPKENDLDYLRRLAAIKASYKIATNLWAESSSRRYRKYGRLVGTLNLVPTNSFAGKLIVYPTLKKLGKYKKYGTF